MQPADLRQGVESRRGSDEEDSVGLSTPSPQPTGTDPQRRRKTAVYCRIPDSDWSEGGDWFCVTAATKSQVFADVLVLIVQRFYSNSSFTRSYCGC